jgi:hypothetical protein
VNRKTGMVTRRGRERMLDPPVRDQAMGKDIAVGDRLAATDFEAAVISVKDARPGKPGPLRPRNHGHGCRHGRRSAGGKAFFSTSWRQ